jgi:hypothetical protein
MAAESPKVFLGLDIGKEAHYGVAIDVSGKVVRQWQVDNTESSLRKTVRWAQQHNAVVIVDQPGGAAALLLRLCWDGRVGIAYLHGLAMARAREFYAGEGKTDPKDAFVLADVARAHPHRVVWLESTPEARAQLGLLCGYDEDLRADTNRVTNRLRMLLLTYSPDLERAFGQRLARPTSLGLLERYPSREALLRAGQPKVAAGRWITN